MKAFQHGVFSSQCQTSIGGKDLDGPKTGHPVDHGAERKAHVAHLAVVLRLLRAREQARGQ
jgi:hypothetical protein